MKKLLTLILAITMCVCLVNLNNNYTKAEGEENPNVSELVAGPTFNATLVNVAGGADKIKSITFVGGKPQQQSEVGKLDVSSEAGKADVYATFDSSTGAITINCVNTTVIPKKDNTQDCYLMFDRFKNCKSISFGNVNFDTSSAITMEYMFSNCNSLEELDVSNLDTSNVKDMYGMFYGCKVMKKLILSENFGAASTTMHGLLCDCFELTDIVTPYQDQGETKYKEAAIIVTDNCFDTHDMFSNCRSLSHIDLSKFDTSNVLDMGHMFSTCLYMTTLDISGFDTTSVLKAEKMFQGCVSLVRIYADDGQNFDNAQETTDMFFNCASITGQNGTTYDAEVIDNTYARIDTETDAGYFTSKDILRHGEVYYHPTLGRFVDTNGNNVDGLSYDETKNIMTMKDVNFDSDSSNDTLNVDSVTLRIPSDTIEIKVIGNNLINNISQGNSREIISSASSTERIKFSGDGVLTLNNTFGGDALVLGELEVDGPTINLYANTLTDEESDASLFASSIVVKKGKINCLGYNGIVLTDIAYEKEPTITVKDGSIEATGINKAFYEMLMDGRGVIAPNAKVTGTSSLISGELSENMRIIEEEKISWIYSYIDNYTDSDVRYMKFEKTEKKHEVECSTSVCKTSTTRGAIQDQVAHYEGVDYYTLDRNDSIITLKGETLTEGEDYTLMPGSVKVTLKKELLNTLPVGNYTFIVSLKDDNGVHPFNIYVNITNPTPSPKKDESCEKVIGPTWHWNNKKGICEDSGSVKTYSR